jgi:hypothetical protein
MVRYARQRDRYSCGPIVLLNALKWAGYQASVREYKKCLMERTSCDRSGTWGGGIDWGLRHTSELAVKKVFHIPTLKELDKEIDKGRALIIRYLDGKGGHYVLCIGRTNKYYTLVNDTLNKTVTRCSRKMMAKVLRKKEVYPGEQKFSVAWSIEPQ